MQHHHSCHCGACPAASQPATRATPLQSSTVNASTITTASSEESSGSPPPGESSEESHRPVDPAYRFSWQIAGMDCPGCARTIETAISQIPDIERIRVLFTTGKLIVEARRDVRQTVEQKVIRAGFQPIAAASATTPGRWQRWRTLMLLSLLIAIAGLVNLYQPLWGDRLFIVSTLVGLWPVACSMVKQVRSGSPFAIETLMTVASAGALLIGAHAEAAMVLLLFQLGERLEAWAATHARQGISALMALKPENAIRLTDQGREQVAVADLRPGDRIEVPAGGRLPADARLAIPFASFDESALSGESVPVMRQQGETVLAGATCVDRLAMLEVVSEPGHSAIDRILHLIDEAESHRAPVERFLDRFSRVYTPAIMLLALQVMLLPPLITDAPWLAWIYKGLTLLLIGCPCALVISTPAAIAAGLAAAARGGALIKGGAALERLSTLRALAFDKTGTLTLGQPQVTAVQPFADAPREALIALAAAVEQGSTHPLAMAIVSYAQQQQLVLPAVHDQQTLAGSGIQGQVAGQCISLLAPARVSTLSSEQQAAIASLEAAGNTLVVVLRNMQPIGVLALQDQLRPEAPQVITDLKTLGLSSIMLTGDNPRAAAAIARMLKLDFQAGLLPEDKVAAIQLRNQREPLGMVGDGINDAPAMKAATLGIAMGSGTDVALETADVALTRNQLRTLPRIITLARATRRVIYQNIALALGLKALFLLTTLLGVTGLWLAVLADSGATVLVTLNALRLLRQPAR